MKRAMTPIEFSSAYLITMNLESFVAVSIKDIILLLNKSQLFLITFNLQFFTVT